MLYCHGSGCPLRHDCYRHTQPTQPRDAFAALPYNPTTGSCDAFVSNYPTEELIRTAAYYIWLRTGRPSGRAHEHWSEAEANWYRNLGREKF